MQLDAIIAGSNAVETHPGSGWLKGIAKRVVCQDGVSLSVQASRTHYSAPRVDTGPYTAVEVGYPSVEPPDSWASRLDGDWERDNRLDNVYGYVPIELVREFVEKHGGEVAPEPKAQQGTLV